jgi:uncharacterized Ntn-hydrolase superfamily protein
MQTISTFSIVARDPVTQELGVAVQSKFLAVGAVVPWAKANVGAIATQAFANLDYGEIGLKLLEKGYTAEETLKALLALDPGCEDRQVGIVDAQGGSVSFTGDRCRLWAGGLYGENFACQGNILVNGETVEALADTFENSNGTLARRLLGALAAAQEAGGDSRGRQSAALLIVRENGSYGGYNDRAIDLRVDDDPEPIEKLEHLLTLHEMYFEVPSRQDHMDVTPEIARTIHEALEALGYTPGNLAVRPYFEGQLKEAYVSFCGRENFETRLLPGEVIDRRVYQHLIQKAKLGQS